MAEMTTEDPGEEDSITPFWRNRREPSGDIGSRKAVFCWILVVRSGAASAAVRWISVDSVSGEMGADEGAIDSAGCQVGEWDGTNDAGGIVGGLEVGAIDLAGCQVGECDGTDDAGAIVGTFEVGDVVGSPETTITSSHRSKASLLSQAPTREC